MGTPTNRQDEPGREQAVPRSALEQMPRAELFALARRRGIPNTMVMTRNELLEAVDRQQREHSPRNGTPPPAPLAERAAVRAQEPPAAPHRPPPRPAPAAPLRSPERKTGLPAPGVAAAAVAAAVIFWRRRR